ncbi:MAG: formyl transferase [Nanoarchaeota archaeon]|nr:formyl transferase [Nanoarchaeota archaeon]
MSLIRLYNAAEVSQLRVAGLMSGSGTNLRKIIEHEQRLKEQRGLSPYHVSVIFSDTPKSKAGEIGADFGIPVFIYDLDSFCKKRGKPSKDMDTRKEYERECMRVLNEFECAVAAYAGYMRKATSVFVNSFLGVNIHPADLTIKSPDGKPRYRGDHVVKDAIQAGEKVIRSTTHLVADKVDCGSILMVSAPLPINYPISDSMLDKIAGHYQDALKERGDWIIFPRTLEYIADGRYARDKKGILYFDGEKIPNGVRLEN